MRLKEFAPSGGGGSGDYFQALASAWYNGVFDTGSLPKGIKTQEDVERLLNRGIVAPDGKMRKYHIDYNSDFDGVEIYSDDYYEYGDHDDTIDSRTGQKWGPYDFMAFGDEQLDESLNEFAPDDSGNGGEEDVLHKYARMWWAADEATQMQIEAALAKMGWEIGEDEGSYDNGGVFVIRAGDVNGDSYTSWAAEDLTEGFARRPRPRNSFRSAQIGYTPDGPLPMADYSKYPTAVIMKAITDLNQDREKNPELIKLLTKELFKRRQQQGMAEARDGDTNFGHTVTRGSWVVYNGSKVKRFKTHTGAKAYAEKNGGKVASSDFYADKIQKPGVAEGSNYEIDPNNPWGSQGRFVGDTGPAQITTTVPRHEFRAGDRVMYKPTGARARIENLYKNGTVARIHVASGMGGQYFDAKVADLRPIGQGRLEEKSTSQAQFRTMAAAAHDPKFARKVGIKQSVAREFNKADKGQSYKSLPKRAD